LPRRHLHPVEQLAARHAGHRPGPAELSPGAAWLERGGRAGAARDRHAGARRLGGRAWRDRDLALAPGEHHRLSVPDITGITGMMGSMRLTRRAKPEVAPEPSAGDELDSGVTGLLRYRRLVIRVLLAIFLLLPAVALLRSHPHNSTGNPGFLILGTLAFVARVGRTGLVQMPRPGQYERWQWLLLPLVVALGAALFAVGGMGWIAALAVAAAAVGRITPDGRPTVIGLVCCTGIAVAISAATGLGYGNTIVAGAVVALGNLLAHSAERRNTLMY